MIFDYEQIEEHLGSRLRNSDYIDLQGGVFLPVKFIGRLMSFAEELHNEARKQDADIRGSILMKEYNRWVDDMIAQTEVSVVSAITEEPVKCQLIDVESMLIEQGKPLAVTLTGDRGDHLVLDAEGDAVTVDELSEIVLDVDFSPLVEHDLEGIEYLASLLIRGAMAMKKELTAEMFADFSDKFFEYFKYDLSKLAPSILEDLQTIADHRLLRLMIEVKK